MDYFGCVNNTIRLRSGLYLDLANPKPDQFKFSDIAGGLSKICRFGGQCEYFYSVAEHSYHCAMQANADGLSVESQRALLLHDAAEAFIGDIVKPLRIMLPDYAAVESRMEDCIAFGFGIQVDAQKDVVRKIDREMLIAERRAMFSADNVTWTWENDVRKIRVEFKKWTPGEAEVMFVFLAREIGIEVSQ